MSRNVKLIITIIVALFNVAFAEAQCAQQTPCHCIGADGMGIDLSHVEALGPFYATGKDDTKVAFQPCKNVALTFPHINSTSGRCNVSSLCLWNKDDADENVGTIEETHWQWVLHKNPELIIKHNKYESHIEILCSNHLDEPQLTYQNVSGTKYMLQLESSKLCKVDMSPKGLSTGSVLVILFFVFAGVYFIGGMAVLTYCRGAIGRESIPNYEFWADLPALVRDGVTFTLSGCSTISYERI